MSTPATAPTSSTEDARDVVVVHPWHFRLLVYVITSIGALIVFLWWKTLRVTVINGEMERELRARGTMFYAPWHRGVLWALYFWRWRGGWLLASASKDGEWATGLIRRFGNIPIRGSSSRGGRVAIVKMVEQLKAGVSGGLIPDAPKGPARVSKPGVLVVSQRSGVDIVPVAIAAERCWRLKSWDRTVLPKPFSRFVVKFAEPFKVDASLEGEAFEKRLREFDKVMNDLADEVDAYFPGKK